MIIALHWYIVPIIIGIVGYVFWYRAQKYNNPEFIFAFMFWFMTGGILIGKYLMNW